MFFHHSPSTPLTPPEVDTPPVFPPLQHATIRAEMSWYYVNKDGFTVGPKGVKELKSLYSSKTITESTFVWNGTTVDTWTALKKVPSIYSQLAPEKAKLKYHARNKSHRKLLKKPSRLSVMNRLKKSKSHSHINRKEIKEHSDRNWGSSSKNQSRNLRSKTSRFSALKLPKKSKNTNKNNKNNKNVKASTPTGTKSSYTFIKKQPQRQKEIESQKQKDIQRERQIQRQIEQQQIEREKQMPTIKNYHQQPLQLQHRESNSSSISVSTGSEPKGAEDTNRGRDIIRPDSISSFHDYSISAAQGKARENQLRSAPELYVTVSANDIDKILDEIEAEEKKQQQTISQIKDRMLKQREEQHNQNQHKSKSKTNSKSKSKTKSKSNAKSHQLTRGHKRGASDITTSPSFTPQQKGGNNVHIHGPHCTHCHHNHFKPTSSNATNKANPRRHGRAGSEPAVDINGGSGIPWQILSNPVPTTSSRLARKTQQENVNIIRKLITSKDININAQNPRDGTTLIMHAIIIGDFDLFYELLRNGANYLISDHDGDDCIDYALLFQRYKICHLLLMINKRMTEQRIYAITKKWGKEAKYMAKNVFGKFKDNLIDFVCKTIEDKGVIGDDMIFKAWYFTLHSKCKVTGNETQPHFSESKLFKTMLKEFGECMKNRRMDRKTWQWIRKYLIQSIIWLLPHPDEQHNIFNEPDSDESDDSETDIDSDVEPDVNEYESKHNKDRKTSRGSKGREPSQRESSSIIIKHPRIMSSGKGYGLDGRTGYRARVNTPSGSRGHTRTGSAMSVSTTASAIHRPESKENVMSNYEVGRKGDKLLLFLFL